LGELYGTKNKLEKSTFQGSLYIELFGRESKATLMEGDLFTAEIPVHAAAAGVIQNIYANEPKLSQSL
jgi:hypothetical protein